MITVYLAPFEFESELKRELALKNVCVLNEQGRLFVTEGPAQTVYWAQQIWQDCQLRKYSSIKEAQTLLKSTDSQILWSLYSVACHRRAKLIEAGLKVARVGPINFGQQIPQRPLGSWTLLSETELLWSTQLWPWLPLGEIRFVEDKIGPPSRAYLKLWESFTRMGHSPKTGERCLDLGSSPGGWTWVLAKLGAEVMSVDKAPLDPKLKQFPLIHYLERSAFSLAPDELGQLDWFCSDVICYPDKLYKFVRKWWEYWDAKSRPNFVCTLKFQGETDMQAVADFASLPGGRLLHLFHNKHELTWIWHRSWKGEKT